MWVILSFITSICITILILSYKYLMNNGVPIPILLFWFFLFGLPLYTFDAIRQGYTINKIFTVDIKYLSIILLLAFVGFISNSFHLKAIDLSPNPGYCDAIILSKIFFISIVSYFAFGSDLSIKKIIGCLLCILGAIIVSI